MEPQEVWVGVQPVILIFHCRRRMLWCEISMSESVCFSLLLMLSTGENNSEGLSVTTGNLPDSPSPGSRTLTSGAGKGQHLKCTLGSEWSKVESYFWLLQGTGLGQLDRQLGQVLVPCKRQRKPLTFTTSPRQCTECWQ